MGSSTPQKHSKLSKPPSSLECFIKSCLPRIVYLIFVGFVWLVFTVLGMLDKHSTLNPNPALHFLLIDWI